MTVALSIDYSDYGTKLTKPQEIADVERVPLSRVISDLTSESGKDYYQAFANTIIFLRATLIAKIQVDLPQRKRTIFRSVAHCF